MKYLLIVIMLLPLFSMGQETEVRVKDIPNVFTPNNDGENDVFIIPNLPDGAIVSIYNRWGNIMAEWDTPSGFWDGTVEGKRKKKELAPAGVYYYLIKFADEKTQKGNVTLLR